MAEKVRLRPEQGSRAASLNREQAVYETNLSRWLADHEGKFVLIKGDKVDGFYESRDEALTIRLRAVRDRTAFRQAGLALRAGPPYCQRRSL